MYNEHFAIVILDQDDKVQDLPYYFDPDVSLLSLSYILFQNDAETNKKAVLEIRVFNWKEYDVVFKVGINLYQGLFQPYLQSLKNKVKIYFYNANRQLMGSNVTFAALVSVQTSQGITLPYNMPDWNNEPLFYLDMTAKGHGVTTVRKKIDKDVFDSTYWDAKQI